MQHHADIAEENDGQARLNSIIDIDTREAPPAEQFDLYRSWNSNLGDVTLLREKFEAFAVRQRVWQLGNLALLSLEYPRTGYRRRWNNKKVPVFDHWVLSIPLTLLPDGLLNHSGQFHWHCLSSPYEAEGEDDGTIALILPRDFAFSQPYDLAIRPEMSALIIDYIQLLHHSLPGRVERDAEHMAVATTSLLSACITPTRDRVFEADGPINAVIMMRAKKLIATQLAMRDLSPEKLCRDLNVSRSRLYRIFETSGGISNYIRRQRLLRTRDILANENDRRSISVIAEEWGFTDPSTYSRTFRREFGVTPKEAREAGRLRPKRSSFLSAEPYGEEGPPLYAMWANCRVPQYQWSSV
ncbi:MULTISPECIES: helix-turn-helix domain-containing protein [Rhizobium/Agrobacterium group]|uniref:helix-turn-helix domain-containing protein n=1 Tax=Rhizobium/Agrobacterium group TaxID=227290 RepID=UPI0022C2E527|nr:MULTISPECIES: helix-turn-helix domain-containing protein [Rhizobium/Agrobacterium group]MCZ7482911.1 helix-turn-helix domain-containing protein [Rhizobium rhizogenes]MCZ7487904.1 helix-turn-helix domain-containing protein [Rhizobium rhizogenes]MDO3444988.1 helix-turn-helix domain-containing protein [Agrobacterium sp. V1]